MPMLQVVLFSNTFSVFWVNVPRLNDSFAFCIHLQPHVPESSLLGRCVCVTQRFSLQAGKFTSSARKKCLSYKLEPRANKLLR